MKEKLIKKYLNEKIKSMNYFIIVKGDNIVDNFQDLKSLKAAVKSFGDTSNLAPSKSITVWQKIEI